MARSLAVAYFPLDEDSYGYPSSGRRSQLANLYSPRRTPAAFSNSWSMSVTAWSANLTPEAIAASLDRLYSDRPLVEALGFEANQTVEKLRINWANVMDHLLA